MRMGRGMGMCSVATNNMCELTPQSFGRRRTNDLRPCNSFASTLLVLLAVPACIAAQ